VTEHLTWTHGGHTIEISAPEMGELVDLAGFDVERVRGVWRCRFDDRVMELEEGVSDPALVVRRIVEGGERPDDSFVWWMDAVRTDREPRERELAARVQQLFDAHWNTRVCRGMWSGPDSDGLDLDPDRKQLTVTGLPMMLHPGRWRLTLELIEGALSDLPGLHVDIMAPGDQVMNSLDDPVEVSDRRISWEFERPNLVFALMIRRTADCVSRPARLAMPISVQPLDPPPGA